MPYLQVEFVITCRYQPHSGAALAQLVRALDCGSRGPPFEPGRWYHFPFRFWVLPLWLARAFGLACRTARKTAAARRSNFSKFVSYFTEI